MIVCDDSGCGEVIASTGGGLVVPHGNRQALSDAIESILTNERLWRRRAVAAGDVARQRFGADVVCSQLEALYADVLAEGARQPA